MMYKFWKKINPYFLVISLMGSSSAIAWEAGWIELIIQYYWQSTTERSSPSPISPSIAPSDSSKLAPDTSNQSLNPPKDLIAWIDSIEEPKDIHSSNMSKDFSQRPSGNRVGCICMDQERQSKKGTGACSGHGGVRFWLYQQDNGWVLEFPTKRHKKHPAPLTAEELSQLASYKRKQKQTKSQNDYHPPTFLDLLMLVIVCMTIAYIVKLWWEKDTV